MFLPLNCARFKSESLVSKDLNKLDYAFLSHKIAVLSSVFRREILNRIPLLLDFDISASGYLIMALEDYAEYRHSVLLWKIMSPMLLLFGTVGNVLTIIVLLRRRNRGNSTAIYLCALAFSDIIVLNTGLMRQWLSFLIDLDIRRFHDSICQIHIFLVYTSLQCSSWLLVAVTSERLIGVWLPHRVMNGCSKRTALIVTSTIVLSLSILNSHWFYGLKNFTSVEGNETYEVICDTDIDDYNEFQLYIWPWVDLWVVCLVPFIILFVGNASIIVRVLLSKQKTRRQVAPSNQSKPKKKDDKTSQLTAMLLLLNAVFFINVSPICIFLLYQTYGMLEAIENDHDQAVVDLWWAVVNMFCYLNNAINFVLYFLSGSRFRAEVKALLTGGRSKSIFGGATTTRIRTLFVRSVQGSPKNSKGESPSPGQEDKGTVNTICNTSTF